MGERQLQLFVHDNWLYIVDPENSMARPGAFDYPASNAPVRYKPESFRDPPVERYDEPIELVDISSPKDSLEVEEMRWKLEYYEQMSSMLTSSQDGLPEQSGSLWSSMTKFDYWHFFFLMISVSVFIYNQSRIQKLEQENDELKKSKLNNSTQIEAEESEVASQQQS